MTDTGQGVPRQEPSTRPQNPRRRRQARPLREGRGEGQQQSPPPSPQQPQETDAQRATRLERELASVRARAARCRTRNDQESQGAQAIRKALVDAEVLKADEQDPWQPAQHLDTMREENRVLRLNQALDAQVRKLGAAPPPRCCGRWCADPEARTLDPGNQQALADLAKRVFEENPEIKARRWQWQRQLSPPSPAGRP